MSLTLMYITNDIEIAKIAEKSGIGWIFIDLETIGKSERQGHLDTVISQHHIDDVKKIKPHLTKSKLLVRINPIHENTSQEIESVINNGADILMLPYFKTKEEVQFFIKCVDNRSKTCLLVETPDAVSNIDDILKVKGIDFIHIGINDLYLGYGKNFMFELLADGTVEYLCKKIKPTGIPYGFGGIAQLGQGMLKSEYVIAEHYRLGSSLAIVSRSFCNVAKVGSILEVKNIFDNGIKKIRDYETTLKSKNEQFFYSNIETVKRAVEKIINHKVT